MSQFVDSREAANKEFKALVRSAKRRGVSFDPAYSAKARRFDGYLVLKSARSWRDKGDLMRAAHCYRIARSHFIIARHFDRMITETK